MAGREGNNNNKAISQLASEDKLTIRRNFQLHTWEDDDDDGLNSARFIVLIGMEVISRMFTTLIFLERGFNEYINIPGADTD